MCQWIKKAGLRGGSGIPILLQAQAKALANFGIARKSAQQDLAWHFCCPGTRDGCHRNCTPITEQVKPPGKVVSPLAISEDALAAFIASCPWSSAPCYFYQPLSKAMQRFACWPSRA